MRNLVFTIFVFSFLKCYSQENYIGFSLGMNQASVVRSNYSYYRSVQGMTIDGNYIFKKNHFFSKSNLGYNQKGSSQELIFVDSNAVILGQGAIEKTRFSYIGITELIGLEYGKEIFVNLGVGLSASYYMYTKVSTADFKLDNGGIVEGYNYKFRNLKPIDLAVLSEICIGFKFKNQSALLLTSSYNLGIKKIKYKDGFTENPWYNNFFSFKIGFRYLLKFNGSKFEVLTTCD
jgi:hypothetical protein